jgi:hypothetical protein
MRFRSCRHCWSAVVVVTCWVHAAAAYRPFDGTDADVAGSREVELEIGPAGYHREGTTQFIVAPALVANYGFLPGFEAVIEGRQDILLSRPRYSSQLRDVAFSIKSLLRSGSLQGGRGLSVALEVGLLLPGSESRFGTHVGSIFSLQLPAVTFHLNLANNILYSLRYEAAASLIIEGPEPWRLRPVAELLIEREFGASRFSRGFAESLLVGGIGRCTDSVSFDLGARYGRADGEHEEEIRAGLTWAFLPW